MRFSLRSLLTTVTLIAIVIVVTLYVTKDYRERMALRGELLSRGASFASVGDDRSIHVLFTEPVTATDFKKYGPLGAVEFKQFSVDAGSLQALAGVSHVDSMMFQSCTLRDAQDLSHLAEIGDIRSLLFWHTPIDDRSIPTILQVPGLETVSFSATKITQAGVDQLRTARPELRVDYRP